MQNKITQLFKIQFPIIHAGGLGLIGSGSMYPHILEEHVIKCKNATNKPFGVNLPMLYPDIDKHVETIIKYKVPIVFTSAGNPKTWTKILHDNGVIVVHVVSSVKFAIKAQEAGVDAVVAEGFEAGGHNGRDETTTFCLIPMVKKEISIPLIAAGGIATGRGMLAAMNLGADAVQIGSRFVASLESSAHQNFKEKVINSDEGDTLLTLKELTPVRLLKNPFFDQIVKTYENSPTKKEDLLQLLGKGRAKKGMFEGDLIEGELEIGQIAGIFNEIKPAKEIILEILTEFNKAINEQQNFKFS